MLLLCGVGQKVSRQLLANELIEGFVGVETLDDVVAERKDALVLIAMVADRVGEAHHIEPRYGHALTEGLAFHRLGDDFREVAGAAGCGRQAGQIQPQATTQNLGRGLRGGLHALVLELAQDE